MSRSKAKPLRPTTAATLHPKNTVPSTPFDVRKIHAKWGEVEIEDLFIGRSEYITPQGAMSGYSGRPKLAQELGSVVQRQARTGTPLTIKSRITALRSLWRTLDEFDTLGVLPPVGSVNDLSVEHGFHIWNTLGTQYSYKIIRGIIGEARANAKLQKLSWPSAGFSVETKEKEIPTPQAVKTVYVALKDTVRALWTRWDSRTKLEISGSDLSKRNWKPWDTRRGQSNKWSLENRVATYAAMCKSSTDLVTLSDIDAVVENAIQQFKIDEVTSYFHPTKEEALQHLWLFLLQTGWNAQVALDIDISDQNWAQPHPTAKPKVITSIDISSGNVIATAHPLIILRSEKSRSNGYTQSAISNSHQDTAPYPLINRYIEQTKLLRRVVTLRIQDTKEQLLNDPDNRKIAAKLHELEKDLASPWLYQSRGRNRFQKNNNSKIVKRLTTETYKSGYGWTDFIKETNAGISARIERIKSAEASKTCKSASADNQNPSAINSSNGPTATPTQWRPPVLVPTSFTLKLLRDYHINSAYTSSGFNQFIAQAAAGHKSISTLHHYLKNQFRRRQAFSRIQSFQEHLFSEVKRGVMDPVVLRKLVDDGYITAEQRARWAEHRDRTRQGTGCLFPLKPPTEIAPQHISGEYCRVQRCVICPHAVIFSDSLDPIARRIAELQKIQTTMPLLAWSNSSFHLELNVATEILHTPEFNKADVDRRISYWNMEIEAGRHVVADMEGSYE